MASKSKREHVDATGCLNVFVAALIGLIGVCQAAGGVGTFVWAMRAIDQQNWIDAAVATAAAAAFGSIGFGLLVAICIARPRVHVAVGSDAPPDEPWLGRPDWAAGKIPAGGDAIVWAPVMAAVALWWNFASLPLLSVLPTFLRQAPDRLAWLVLLVPVAGLLLVWAFLYQFYRARKFGRSVFEMASVPGVVGGQLAGVVRIPRAIEAPDGFRVRLVCVEWLEHHGQKRNTRVDHVVWQEERLVKDTLVEGGETGVPVLMAIPFEAPETWRPESKREFEWRLEVRAHLPGIDYAATFEVPVYKTAESRRGFQLDEKLQAQYGSPTDNPLVLRDAGIGHELLDGDGVRLVFRAARNWRTALFVSAILLMMGAVVAVLLFVGQDEMLDFGGIPRAWQRVANNFDVVKLVLALFRTLLAVVFGGMLALILFYFTLVSIDLWLYRSVVEASPAGLTFRGGWLGIGRRRHFAPDDIRRFKLEKFMWSSGGGLWQSVVLVPRRGRGEQLTLGKGIASKLAQEAVIDELNRALGRG